MLGKCRAMVPVAKPILLPGAGMGHALPNWAPPHQFSPHFGWAITAERLNPAEIALRPTRLQVPRGHGPFPVACLHSGWRTPKSGISSLVDTKP